MRIFSNVKKKKEEKEGNPFLVKTPSTNYPINRVSLDIFLEDWLKFYISKTPWF